MPRGPKGEKRPADLIGNAVHVMRIATGEIADSAECWMLGKRPSRTFGRDVRPRTTLLRLWRQARPKQLLHDRGRPGARHEPGPRHEARQLLACEPVAASASPAQWEETRGGEGIDRQGSQVQIDSLGVGKIAKMKGKRPER
jgi:hypothetical protein